MKQLVLRELLGEENGQKTVYGGSPFYIKQDYWIEPTASSLSDVPF